MPDQRVTAPSIPNETDTQLSDGSPTSQETPQSLKTVIRYADKEKDKAFFQQFLNEKEARKYLDIQGAIEDEAVKNDRWNATFIIEDQEKKKSIGFGKISLSSTHGWA